MKLFGELFQREQASGVERRHMVQTKTDDRRQIMLESGGSFRIKSVNRAVISDGADMWAW